MSTIRDARSEDWAAIWPFFGPIVEAGDTFSYPLGMSSARARELWMLHAPSRTVVAVEQDGQVVGTANMHPNWSGPAAHIASGNFMVDPAHAGRGIGRELLEETLAWARREGYRAMLFNAVAETNERAVRLYRSAGFEILSTVPEGFNHPADGFVGLHAMYRAL